MSKLKNKKYYALLGIVVLVIGLISLFVFGKIDKYKGQIKLKNVVSKTTSLSASVMNTVENETTSKGSDEIRYSIRYTLDRINGVTARDVVINASLNSSEARYARFKEINRDNITSTITNNGKEIEVHIENVLLGEEQNVVLKLEINNAPNGYKVKPSIKIKEETGEETNVLVEEVEVVTNSLLGNVRDDKELSVSNIELSLNDEHGEVRRTYTDEDGNFVFSDIENKTYRVDVKEEIYEKISEETINDRLNIKIKEVSPYEIEAHKYITKLDLVINGKEEHYTYNDLEKVVQAVKNAKTISGEITYKISVRNIGEKDGRLSKITDIVDEGLSFDKSKNTGWTEKKGKLYYSLTEDSIIKTKETRDIGLRLDIKNTNDIKTYINEVDIDGEAYEKVVYILNGEKYKEEIAVLGEKITEPEIQDESFSGWYTDRNFTNKYNFKNEVTKDLILYGKTDVITHTVEFYDKNPETGTETKWNEQEVEDGKKLTEPTEPSHTGYTFECWMDEQDNIWDFNNPVTRDMRLTSCYTINRYTVLFIDEGEEHNRQTVAYKGNIVVPENPTKQYHTFKYWHKQNETEAYDLTTPVTEDVTLYSKYERNKHTITFVDKYPVTGIEASRDNVVVNEGEKVDKPTDPSKIGYEFTCWETENHECYDFTKPVLSDQELTSKYSVIIYTILYEGITSEEETALNNPISYTVETETITLNNPSNRRDSDNDLSEIFVGWTGSNGDTPETIITIPKGSTGNKKYIANWIDADPDVYPITYNLKDGDLEEGKTNPSSYTKTTPIFTLNNPKKTGYNFTGWSGTDLVGQDNTTVTITKGSRGARAYEAWYTPKNYTIEYVNNCGVVENPNSYTIETPTFNLNNPSKAGYRFTGWTTEDDDTKRLSVTIEQGSTGNKKYIATCEPIVYHITYELHDGEYEQGKSNPETYTIETPTFTLNNPGKEHYIFTGWTGSNGDTPETTVTIEQGSIGDKNYEASYEKITHQVTFKDKDPENPVPETATDFGNPITVDDGDPVDSPVTNPEHTGYICDKWSKKIDGNYTTDAYDFNTEVTSDLTLYTLCKKREYTVTYMNGDILYGTDTVLYKEKTTAPEPDPTKAHHIFKGWTLNNTAFNFNTEITDNITLYSSYEEVLAPEISHTPTEWTNQDVTVTVSKNSLINDDTGYTYKYRIEEGQYNDYSGPFLQGENCDVYAVAYKQGVASVETKHEIRNIDKIKPRIDSITASDITANSFKINLTGHDDESGLSEFRIYKNDEYVTTVSYLSDFNDSKSEIYEFTGLEQKTVYKVKVIAVDRAGNTKESDELEVETNELVIVVAQITHNDGVELDEYIPLSTLRQGIIYNQDGINCNTEQCTIQMLANVTETNDILDGQDITLDLNGFTITGLNDYTFSNNGSFTVVDRSQDRGTIVNNTHVAIINTNKLTIGEGTDGTDVSEAQPYIYGNSFGIKTNGTFNFYDGKIEGLSSISGSVTDTPLTYNANVTYDDTSGSTHEIATLQQISDAEARIGRKYYTLLTNAIDDVSRKTIPEATVPGKLMTSFTQVGDYGFDYDEQTNSLISNNNYKGSEAKAYTYIDLRSSAEDQELDITGYYEGNDGTLNYVVKDEDNNVITPNRPLNNGGSSTSKYILPKGHIYYLELDYKKSGTAGSTEESTTKNVITDISLKNYITLTPSSDSEGSETLLYGFDYDSTTGTLRSNNTYRPGTTAFSYIEVDLTSSDVDKELIVNASLTCSSNSNFGNIFVKEQNTIENYATSSGAMTYVQGSSSKRNYYKTLQKGKKYYIQFYYFKQSETVNGNSEPTPEDYEAVHAVDQFVIHSLDLIDVVDSTKTVNIDLSTELKTASNNGLSLYDSYYGYYAYGISGGKSVDSYVKVDLSDATEDQLLRINSYLGSTSGLYKYFYITSNNMDNPFTSLVGNNNAGMIFNYYYNEYTGYYINGSSVYYNNNNYDFVLPKGNVYYVHFATFNNSGSNSVYSSYINSVSVTPITGHTISMGKLPYTEGTIRSESVPGIIKEDETSDKNFRLISSTVNNYVTFNNETWRIVGVFDTEDASGNTAKRMKLIRNYSIGNYMWDASHIASGSNYGSHDWSQSDLMKMLNPGYDNETGGSLYWNKTNGPCYTGPSSTVTCYLSGSGLTEEAKNYIDEVKWNVGLVNTPDGGDFYNYYENKEKSAQWLGKVGLPIVSDYVLSSGDGPGSYTRSYCLDNGIGSAGTCFSNNSWMRNMFGTSSTWLMTGSDYVPPGNLVHYYYNGNSVTNMASSISSFNVYPMVYLNPKTYIKSGKGTSSDPYKLELKDEDNPDTYYGLNKEKDPIESGTITMPDQADSFDELETTSLYSFDFDSTTGEYVNNNIGTTNTMAVKYLEFDMTDETANTEVLIDYSYNTNYSDYTFLNILTEKKDLSYTSTINGSTVSACNPNNGSLLCGSSGTNSGRINYTFEAGKKYYVYMAYYKKTNQQVTSSIADTSKFKITMVKNDETSTDNYSQYIPSHFEYNEPVETVQLLKNVSLSSPAEIISSKDVVLDLNGYIISKSTSGQYVLRNEGNLKIIDSTCTEESTSETLGKVLGGTSGGIYNADNAYLEIEQGVVSSDYNSNGSIISNYGTLKVGEDGYAIGKGSVYDYGNSYLLDSTGTFSNLKHYSNVDSTVKGIKVDVLTVSTSIDTVVEEVTVTKNIARDLTEHKLVVNNSNFTGMASNGFAYSSPTVNLVLGSTTFNYCTFNGGISVPSSSSQVDDTKKGGIYVNNSTFNKTSGNQSIISVGGTIGSNGYVELNNCELTHTGDPSYAVYNRHNRVVLNNTTIISPNEAICNAHEYESDANQTKGYITLNNVDIITTGMKTSYNYSIYNSGKMTIDGGSISNEVYYSKAYGIKNVGKTASSSPDYFPGELTITNDFTLNAANYVYGIDNYGGKLTLGDNTDAVSKTKPYIGSTKYGVVNTVDAIFNFYDGKIEGETNNTLESVVASVPTNYDIHKETTNNKDIFTLISTSEMEAADDYVASVNGVNYSSISDAIEAVPTTGVETEVIILKNVLTANPIIIPENKNVKIVYDNHTIKGYKNDAFIVNNGTLNLDGNDDIDNNFVYSNISINNNGTLTSSARTVGVETPLVNNENAIFNLTGGYLTTSTKKYVINNKGKLNISGGTVEFSTNNFYSCLIMNTETGELNLTGHAILRNASSIIIQNSNKINVDDYSYPVGYTNMFIYNINDNCDVTISDSTFGVNNTSLFANLINNSKGTVVISDSNIYYTGQLENKGTMTLNNVTTYSVISNNSPGILTMNGGMNTCAKKPSSYQINNSSTMTINGTLISCGSDISTISNSKDLTILSGQVQAGKWGIVNSAGTLTIGEKGGVPDKTDPRIEGDVIGVKMNGGTFNFYDGRLVGASSVTGTIAEIEDGYDIINEQIDGKENTYLDNDSVIENTRTHEIYGDIQTAIDEAENGDQLNLLRDYTVLDNKPAYVIPDNKSITINLYGNKIISNNELLFDNKGTLTMDACYIEAGETNCSKTGTVISNGGKVFKNTGSLIIDGGRYGNINSVNMIFAADDPDRDRTPPDIVENSADLILSGGSLVAGTIVNNGTFNFSDGELEGVVTTNNAGGIVNITGGIIRTQDSAPQVNSEFLNYSSITISDTTNFIGTVNNKTIDSDLTVTGGSFSRLTIENAGTVTVSDINPTYFGVNNSNSMIVSNVITGTTGINSISNSGTITINDSSIYGYVTNTGTTNLIDSTIYNNVKNTRVINITTGTINIENCIIESNANETKAIEIKGGTINLKSGTVTSRETAVNITEAGKLVLGTNDGTVSTISPSITGRTIGINNENLDSQIEFYDGIITSQNELITDTTIISKIAPGYNLIYGVDSQSKQLTLTQDAMVRNNSTNVTYNNLQTAVDAAGNGATLEVLRDLIIPTENEALSIPSGKEIILDLAGKKIIQDNDNFIENNGNLTIKTSVSGGMIKTNKGNIVKNNGTLTINGGDYTSNSEEILFYNTSTGTLNYVDGDTYNIVHSVITNSGVFNMSGGIIRSTRTEIKDCPTHTLINNTNTGTINITDGYIKHISDGSIIDNYGNVQIFDVDVDTLGYSHRYCSNGCYDQYYGTRFIYNQEGSTATISGGTYGINNILGALFVNKGTMNISNVTSNLNYDNINYSITGSTSENLTITSSTLNTFGGEFGGYSRIENNVIDGISSKSIKITGHVDLIGNTISNNNINVKNGNFNNNTFTNTPINFSNGTLNITGGTYNSITQRGNSTLNVTSGTIDGGIDASSYSNNYINIGTQGGTVSTSDPIIKGPTYGIQGGINFYDGIIMGPSNSISGSIISVESGYKEYRSVTVDPDTGSNVISSILIPEGQEVSNVAVYNNINYPTLQAAINACPDDGTEAVITLYSNIVLDEELTVSEGKNIIVYLNGNTITPESYVTDHSGTGNISIESGVPSGAGGAIYRFLASITGQEINAKNIIVYQMNDGTELDAATNYKLYKFIDNDNKIVKVNEEEIGDYKPGNDTDILRTTNGQIKINGIGEGSYKLVGSDGKELDFNINQNGVSNNIRENRYQSLAKKSVTAIATLILQLQTGISRNPYMLIILILVLVISGFIAYKKKKESL